VGLLRSLFPLYLFGSEGYGARLGVQARATEASSALAPFVFTWALGLSTGGLLSGLILLGGGAFLATGRIVGLVAPAPAKTGPQNSDTFPQDEALSRSSR
jgi:hypothetical protein